MQYAMALNAHPVVEVPHHTSFLYPMWRMTQPYHPHFPTASQPRWSCSWTPLTLRRCDDCRAVETHHLLQHTERLNVNHTAVVMADSPLRLQVVLQSNKAQREVALRQDGYYRHNVHVLAVAHHQFH